jgi:hypothetical protein
MQIYANGNTIEIHMTKNEAMTCSHQGQCDADCAEMVKRHPRMTARMNRDVLISAFIEYGAWSRKELEAKSDTDLREIALWSSAGDINDNSDSHGWSYIDGSYYMAHREEFARLD